MKNILIGIFIILFILLLLNTLISNVKSNKIIEGLEEDDTDLSIKERLKKLQDRVNKIQDQIDSAEKSNEDNIEMIKKMEKVNK
jgi:uncharacterized protein YlxW (UPF0749 family)